MIFPLFTCNYSLFLLASKLSVAIVSWDSLRLPVRGLHVLCCQLIKDHTSDAIKL
ncbi:hypothetical protein [Pontibacter fetidus]|uniref:Uncharacterized protein n=1 Tax=Pontibacter fetidus TaxID=2700082 RepID=A0A6B2H643_9BACT|nr:hypothetical protein [Pontibacter fetidus]NDK56236.1 hypothetical protein [Pontibacter fetidus]